MIELSHAAIPHIIDDRRFQIDENRAWHLFSIAGLREEGPSIVGRGVVTHTGTAPAGRQLLLGLQAAVQVDAVLQQVQLPAGIADLDAALANLDGDYFALAGETIKVVSWAREGAIV